MARNRKRKTTKCTVEKSKMKEAVLQVVNEKYCVRRVAENLSVNRTTLQRYVDKYKKASEEERLNMRFAPNYKVRSVFSTTMELELKTYLIEAAKMHHGLTRKQVMVLAYEMAITNNIKCPSTWNTNGQAGIDWYYNFMGRWPELSLRKPEGTSLARSTSFNQHAVSLFFNNLEEAYRQLGDNLSPARIYNLDETGLTTVHNPPKIVAPKGQKQVGQVTSGERGILVTACCFISASGNTVPPYLIFPRVYFKLHMLNGAPHGAAGNANPSGWMNGTIFVDVLRHFQRHTKASVEDKVLLILDNHESHITINSLNFCKNNGIVLLTLPPHTSHKLQPLDRTVYGALKTSFNQACNNWMISHPGKPITIYNISSLFGQAYESAFTIKNINRGFEVTGIWPLNRNIFGEDEFLCSFVTDRPQALTSSNNELGIKTVISENLNNASAIQVVAEPKTTVEFYISNLLDFPVYLEDAADADAIVQDRELLVEVPYAELLNISNQPSTCSVVDVPVTLNAIDVSASGTTTIEEISKKSAQVASTASNKLNENVILPITIRPFPKAGERQVSGRPRKRKCSAILTNSPVKNAICEELSASAAKRQARNCRTETRKKKENCENAEKTITRGKKIKKEPKKTENSLPKKDEPKKQKSIKY